MSLTKQSQDVLQAACKGATEALGEDLVAFDVTGQLPFADVFLLVTADNPRHLRSVVDSVDRSLSKAGVATRVEGSAAESEWVLVDGQDVVVHVQLPQARTFYALDKLWADSPRLDLGSVCD